MSLQGNTLVMAAHFLSRHISGILSTWFWTGVDRKQAKTTYQGSPHNPRTCIDFTKTQLIHGHCHHSQQLPTVIISGPKSDLPPGSSMETGRDLEHRVAICVGGKYIGI